MKVLIIGGTRYLGREIMLRLADRGDEVTVLNRGRTQCELPDNVECATADITEPQTIVQALEGERFDTCVHMIAMNGERARTVIESVWGIVEHYVQCGSTGVFMPLKYVPGDEDHPVDPPADEWGGFNGKAASDRVARELCAQYDLPLTILRPTAIIGPGDVPLDYWGGRDPRLFQTIVDGNPIVLPERGEGLVQFGDVRDLADAFVLAVDQPDRSGEYNISSRYAITHNYYAELLAEAMDVPLQVEHMPAEEIIERNEAEGLVSKRGMRFFAEHMCFTIEKVCKELGYDPRYTAEDSVEQSVRWMFDNNVIVRG
jgi:nucleoside-diphosphate-sugar epimerase